MSNKLPARYYDVLMPLILSIFMTCIVSGISTLSSFGFTGGVLSLWMRAWSVSWIVAFPTLLLVLPLVRRLVSVFVDAPEA